MERSVGAIAPGGRHVLLKGLNHVAVITHDASRLNDFYRDVFDAEILRDGSEFPEGKGTPPLHHQDWRLGRAQRVPDRWEQRGRPPDADVRPGPVDHLALQAASLDAFEAIRGGSWPGCQRDRASGRKTPGRFRCRANFRATSVGRRPARGTVRKWAACGRGSCRGNGRHTCRIRIWAGSRGVGRRRCNLRS